MNIYLQRQFHFHVFRMNVKDCIKWFYGESFMTPPTPKKVVFFKKNIFFT